MKTVKDRQYSFNHTQKRLKERYDIEITMKDYNYLCDKVKGKKDAVPVMVEIHNNDTQYIYDLQFQYRGTIRVVWSEKRKCITTVLRRNINEFDNEKIKKSNTTR